MRILFDIGHPAHVHLFRNFINYLKENGVEIVVVSRDKEITNLLLDHFRINYFSLSKQSKGLGNMFFELLSRDWNIFKLHWKSNFIFAFGTSVSIGHLSAFSKVKSFNFNEDDDDIVPLYAKIAYPFSTKIVVPSCLEFRKWKQKRVIHNSYHELAYLHPNNFTPDLSILKKYNLQPDTYIITRFSSLEAHHDIGIKGISKSLWVKIEEVIKGIPLISSVENRKTHDIDPWDMHHVLAFAGMVISDSQTMSAEAAVLGIPSIRINSFARQIGYLKELEFKYELTKSFLPEEEEEILAYISLLINNGFEKQLFKKNRELMLSEKVDLNKWMIDYYKEQLEKL
jgi:predicted glycosyltransferase